MKTITYTLLIGLLHYGVYTQTSTDINVEKTAEELVDAKAAFEKASKEVTAYFEAKKNKKKTLKEKKVKTVLVVEDKQNTDLSSFKESDEGITADFTGHSIPVFCFVKEIDYDAGATTIGFKNGILKDLIIPNTLGGSLKKIKIKGFKKDLLLFEGEIEDPQFINYHLFIVKNNTWVPVINPFSIHENHVQNIEKPIWADPQNPAQLIRCYSVFDLENQNKGLDPWTLLTEEVAIINK